MIIGLPHPDTEHAVLLKDLREQHERIGEQLADAELKSAALIAHAVWGADAAGLLLDMQVSEEPGSAADASLLLVLDADGEVLWFNPYGRHDTFDHPAAAHLHVDDHGNPLPVVDEEVAQEIVGHVEAAYEAVGYGCHGALDPGQDDYFPQDSVNLLYLDLDGALD